METNWNIDTTHTDIGFKVKHMMISNVSGSFAKFSSTAQTNGDDFNNAKFEFSAEIDSISTGMEDRDAHLKSDDFFNAEQFPQLSFKSSSVEVDGDDITVEGEMTIRDITKPLTLKGEVGGIVTDPYGQVKAGISLNGAIKRSEFGLKWNAITEAGSIVVSDTVKLNTELQFVKQA